MKKYKFYTALTQAYEFYGVELDEDLFETYAMSAWHKIGNRDYKMYKLCAIPEPDCEGRWFVKMPCNLDLIEAITLPFEDALSTSPIVNNLLAYTLPVELDIEHHKIMPNEHYIPGKYVKYKELGDKIYFTEPFKLVNILYKGLYADEDGLPFLSNDEIEAIAAYCAFCVKYKEGIMTKDSGTLLIAALLKLDWLKLCDRARLPEAISQNSMLEILDAMTSWNRHMYGRTLKPIN